jgi:hypothetical protein
MAQTTSSDTGGGFWTGLFGGVKDIAGLAIEYERAKNIDVETINDSDNIPDQNDLVYGTDKQAGSDSLGGVLSVVPAIGGSSVTTLALGGLAIVGAVYFFKKVR